MPGFSQTQLNYAAQNANMVTVLIGDQPIAFAQVVNHSLDMGAETQYGVGSPKPQEIQQLKFAPTITVSSFALTAAGKLQIQGNSQNLISLLSNNQFNLHVVDGSTGQSLYTYVGCVAGNFSENIGANAVIADDITFTAMDVLDTTGKSILNGPQALII